MKNQTRTYIALSLLSSLALSASISTYAAPANDSRQPRNGTSLAPSAVPARPMDPKNVPDFAPGEAAPADAAGATGPGAQSSALRVGLESATVPVQTHLKLICEYPIDAKTSLPGDIFEAHVRDDLFIGNTLVLPRGSLVRGRVSEITKPRLLSRAGKIGLKLDQIVTPTGEVIPLDAALEFQKGMTNKSGQLDPGTNFGTRVNDSVKSVSGLKDKGATKGALIAANVATLGAPIVATAIGSSAIALFSHGDTISLRPGQELEVLLTNDLGLQVE